MDILEKAQWRAMKTVKGLTHRSYMEMLRESWDGRAWRRENLGGISSMHTDIWWEGVNKAPSSGAQQEEKGNGQRLNSRKMFFTVKVAGYCNKLLREVVEPSSLEIFKTQLGTYLSKLLQLIQPWAGGGTRWFPQAFPVSNRVWLLWFSSLILVKYETLS